MCRGTLAATTIGQPIYYAIGFASYSSTRFVSLDTYVHVATYGIDHERGVPTC